jgi:hypothetical protein
MLVGALPSYSNDWMLGKSSSASSPLTLDAFELDERSG